MSEKLTKEQIVAVAKDVIVQIRARKFIAAQGTYFSGDIDLEGVPDGFTDLQKLLKADKLRECEVCARGAIVLSKARLFNDVPVEVEGGTCEIDLSSSVFQESSHHFSSIYLMVEMAFEQQAGNYNPFWARRYKTPEKRLVALMRNVIFHKGDFVFEAVVNPKTKRNWVTT